MSQAVEFPLLQILLDQTSVEGRRSTENTDREVCQGVQDLCGGESWHAMYEDSGSLGPGTKHSGPGRLGPAWQQTNTCNLLLVVPSHLYQRYST